MLLGLWRCFFDDFGCTHRQEEENVTNSLTKNFGLICFIVGWDRRRATRIDGGAFLGENRAVSHKKQTLVMIGKQGFNLPRKFEGTKKVDS